MKVKEIIFETTKASGYYTLGCVRIYFNDKEYYPIKFASKNHGTSNSFYIEHTNITGSVSTSNSYGTYYFVDSPFDTDKSSTVASYSYYNYWLSSGTGVISIKFDEPINIYKINFIPYSGDGSDRKQNAVNVKYILQDNSISTRYCDTSQYVPNQIFTLSTPEFLASKGILLKSKNKIYSFKDIFQIHYTNMRTDNNPAPFVTSASSTWSSTSYLACVAFNGTVNGNTDCWASSKGDVHNAWIQIDYGERRLCNQVLLTSRDGTDVTYQTSFPKKINIVGSNDGINFKFIKQESNLICNKPKQEFKIEFTLSNYRYYRIEILENNGNIDYNSIAEILFSVQANELYEYPYVLQKYFGNYNTTQTNLKTLNTIKIYVLDNDKQGKNKMLKKVDRKPKQLGIKNRERGY